MEKEGERRVKKTIAIFISHQPPANQRREQIPTQVEKKETREEGDIS